MQLTRQCNAGRCRDHVGHLGWGGETQALIHNPVTGKVIAITARGAPTEQPLNISKQARDAVSA